MFFRERLSVTTITLCFFIGFNKGAERNWRNVCSFSMNGREAAMIGKSVTVTSTPEDDCLVYTSTAQHTFQMKSFSKQQGVNPKIIVNHGPLHKEQTNQEKPTIYFNPNQYQPYCPLDLQCSYSEDSSINLTSLPFNSTHFQYSKDYSRALQKESRKDGYKNTGGVFSDRIGNYDQLIGSQKFSGPSYKRKEEISYIGTENVFPERIGTWEEFVETLSSEKQRSSYLENSFPYYEKRLGFENLETTSVKENKFLQSMKQIAINETSKHTSSIRSDCRDLQRERAQDIFKESYSPFLSSLGDRVCFTQVSKSENRLQFSMDDLYKHQSGLQLLENESNFMRKETYSHNRTYQSGDNGKEVEDAQNYNEANMHIIEYHYDTKHFGNPIRNCLGICSFEKNKISFSCIKIDITPVHNHIFKANLVNHKIYKLEKKLSKHLMIRLKKPLKEKLLNPYINYLDEDKLKKSELFRTNRILETAFKELGEFSAINKITCITFLYWITYHFGKTGSFKNQDSFRKINFFLAPQKNYKNINFDESLHCSLEYWKDQNYQFTNFYETIRIFFDVILRNFIQMNNNDDIIVQKRITSIRNELFFLYKFLLGDKHGEAVGGIQILIK